MMLEHRYVVLSTFLPLSFLSINRESVQYNINQSMDGIQFGKNMLREFLLQHFYSQGHYTFSYLDSTPSFLSLDFSCIHQSSKQFPQSEKAVLLSNNVISSARQKRRMVGRHLAWLKHSILKTVKRLLWVAFTNGNYSPFQFDQNFQEDSLLDYLRKGKSLIPKKMIRSFKRSLTQQLGFKRILQWVYGHVQPKFGDQLILIAHKVLKMYLPLKQNGLSCHQIRSILNLPFSLFDIHNDPSLRILNFSSFCKKINGADQLDAELYRFCVAYIDTILLVLEGQFQNPYFKQIQQQKEGGQDGSICGPWKKKKKIAKRK